MRIAFFTVLNPISSGESDYSEELLPYLSKYCEIDIFTDDHIEPSNKKILRQFPCYGYTEFEAIRKKQQYDNRVFQLACNAYHIKPYEYLLQYGGVTTLHDANISGIIGAQTFGQGDKVGYFRQILILEGFKAFAQVVTRFLMTRKFPEWTTYPMNSLVIKKSSSIIVHNEYIRDAVSAAISRYNLQTPVWKVPMGVPLNDWMHSLDTTTTRKRLGLDKYDFIIASFGTVDERKRISVALRAFSRLLQVIPNAIYILAGTISTQHTEKIRALGLENHVKALGRVDMRRFYEYMVACDFCVNLRYPTIGETSATLLRVMSIGKPVAITNHAQFQEYPDDCCIKITPDESEEDNLFEKMCQLAKTPTLRASYSQRASKYIEDNNSLEQTARGYYKALKRTASATLN